MSPDFPSDVNAPAGIRRRDAVLAAAAVVAQSALLGWPTSGGAQAAASTAGASAVPADSAAVARFLAFSKAITGHDDIDPLTSSRIREAMRQGDAALAGQIDALGALLQPGMTPDALLDAAASSGLRGTALSVVAAWYTGTVVAGGKTTVVAYEQALMYRPVADGLTVPTYCNEGPLWWTAPPPEAGVPPPQQAVHASPTPPPVMRSQ